MKSKIYLLLFLTLLSFQKGMAQYVVVQTGAYLVFNSTVGVVFQSESIQNDGGTTIDPLSYTYLTGSSNVIVTGNNYLTLGNLTINNSSGVSAVTLNQKLHTATLVTFTNGVVVSTLTNNLTFNATSTVTGASDASHVNGPVRKAGGADFIFPVGNAAYYRQAAVTAHALVDTFTTTYFLSNPKVAYGVAKDVTINHIDPFEYWTINRLGVTDNAKVTLSWNINTTYTINVITDLIVTRWDGAAWRDHGGTGHTGNSSNGTVITPALVTSFSPFTLGSTTSTSLPIELLDFHASCEGKNTLVTWSTGSETNNASYTIEKSDDGKNFYFLTKVSGAGNSSTTLNYSVVDKTASSGTVYYRLSQTDFDNTHKEVGITFLKAGSCQGSKSAIDFVYTSPEEVKLLYTASQEGDLSINMYTTGGSSLHSFRHHVMKGSNAITLNITEFAAGMYFINCLQGSDVSNTKVVLGR